MDFSPLGLSPELLQALSRLGHAAPTPVQQAIIPPALAGRDLRASAQTGSGKTLAYALPLLQLVAAAPRERPRRTAALVLVPTRELAAQVADTLKSLSRALTVPLKSVVLIGGASIEVQRMALRGGADIVVATPGRLLDLVDQRAVRLDLLSLLVLDEADRLLDSGFSDELARVLALLPPLRQTLLLSATFPPGVQALAKRLLHDPLHVDVVAEPVASPELPSTAGITQRAIRVDTAQRTPLLRHLIATEAWSRVLVFVASQYASELVADKLRRHGLAAAAFHGDLAQGTRQQVLADFKAGRLQVVVATDLAARGIDITLLPVVVNRDLARSAVDHLHRIGRTGRAGASGLAVSFIRADQPQAEAHFRLIEKRQGQRIPREQIAGFEPTAPAVEAPPSTGGIKGTRKSKKDKLRERTG
jgi:ATP-dependent RNA helicase RhlE